MPHRHVFDMTCEGRQRNQSIEPPLTLTLTLSPFQVKGNGERGFRLSVRLCEAGR